MRVISRNVMSAFRAMLSMGCVGLFIVPLLRAQDFRSDIARGKDVYQRNCQICHGIGGWGDGLDA